MLDFLRRILGQKILNYYHLAMAIIANFVYWFPSRKLHVIGVTGTDGKTTTVNMIASIFRAGGYNTAYLSTVDAQIGGRVYDTGLHTTTPSSFFLQKMIAKAARAGARYMVLEVTSHALDQFRTWGIEFETAVLTNVSHEHLDYHKDLESYQAAKARLFRKVEYRILNMDDISFGFFSKNSQGKLLTYGINPQAVVWADNLDEELTETKFIVHIPAKEFKVKLNLPGRFNISNALAAIAVGMIYKLKHDALSSGLESIKGIPGRLELIDRQVMVDFAHTPNALEKLFEFLRPKIKGKIIHVFGSAGERDQTKRPLMGAVADKYSDTIILTREDNRSENVEDICEEIIKGIKGRKRGEGVFVIPDRRQAIRKGLELVGINDLVVITGKGHEQSLNVDGNEVSWDDRKMTAELLKQLSPGFPLSRE